jgi:hypothetical protein
LLRASCVESLERRLCLSVNVLVHHGDTSNTGANLTETVLTPANVNSTDFGKLFSTALDGRIYAQPLYVQSVNITRGSETGIHSVVFAATMNDSLYAIDAVSGAVIWQDSFLNTTNPTSLSPTSGVTAIPGAAIGGTGVGPMLGILATPAIDLSMGSAGAIFLNAATQEVRGSQTHFVQRLWSVSLANGSPLVSPAVIGDTVTSASFYSYGPYQYVSGPIVDGSGNNPKPTTYPDRDGWSSAPGGATEPVIAFNSVMEMQRTGVTLLNGNVYLGFASHGDDGPYYGWILGYRESTLALTAAFVTTPTYEGIAGDREDYTAQGGIWMSGSAIATDGTSLYVTTGNGAFDTSPSNFNSQGFPIDHDYSDSLIKLQLDTTSSPTNQNGNGWGLKVVDYFTPSNAVALNTLDLDLGSGGVLLLPTNLKDKAGDPMLMFGGKESRLYLLDADNLGKFNTSYPMTGDSDPKLYDRVLGEYAGAGIDGTSSGIYATPAYLNGEVYFAPLSADSVAFNVSSFATSPTPVETGVTFSYPGATFTISANGTSNAILWGMDVKNADLLAFTPNNLSTPIYDSNTISSDSYSQGVTFGVPTVADGRVYSGDEAGTLVGYGLRPVTLPNKLTGTVIGTTGSYQNDGNTISKAVDGNLTTFFDGPSANGNWVGLDLGSAKVITSIAYASRSGFSSRMNGGVFQASNSSTFSTGVVNLYTIASNANPSSTALTTQPINATTAYRYVRYLSPSGSYGNIAELQFSGRSLSPLIGTTIGTSGSYENDGNTSAKATDGNLTTFFDGPAANGNWVGLDLGATESIQQISFAPRLGFASRMVGGEFQISTTANFSSGVTTIYTITATPAAGGLTTISLTSPVTARYVRYLSPNGSYGNIAEIAFFG